MADAASLLLGSFTLRPYVFGFLLLHLVAAVGEWGWRGALAFTALASGMAFAAEFASTRVGVPFGLYHYTGATQGREAYLGNVPLFDPLSFAFLAYASLGLARLIGRRVGGEPAGRGRVTLVAGLLMMWLDLVIDPLAVRGDRWFLGRIFYYPAPGFYFGVPLANFAGWAALGSAIAAVWLRLELRLGSAPSRWAARLPGQPGYCVLLYYLVLAFNLVLTAVVAEPGLFWTGVALHLPLAAVVVSSVTTGGKGRGPGGLRMTGRARRTGEARGPKGARVMLLPPRGGRGRGCGGFRMTGGASGTE